MKAPVQPGKKTGKKTGIMVSPRSGAACPTGAHRQNTGGKKGRSGRKPEWLRDWCDDLLADPTSREQVEAILHDAKHPAFATMWTRVAERAHGKPREHVEHTGTVRHEHRVMKWGNVEIPL